MSEEPNDGMMRGWRTIFAQQQKRRVMNARHQALTNAHHSMLLATFANHNASKWLHHNNKLMTRCWQLHWTPSNCCLPCPMSLIGCGNSKPLDRIIHALARSSQQKSPVNLKIVIAPNLTSGQKHVYSQSQNQGHNEGQQQIHLPELPNIVEQQLRGNSVYGESQRKLSGDDHRKHTCSGKHSVTATRRHECMAFSALRAVHGMLIYSIYMSLCASIS